MFGPLGSRLVTFAKIFLGDLAFSLVPNFVLGIFLTSWVFSSASMVLLEV
jgi:hypothetical protein